MPEFNQLIVPEFNHFIVPELNNFTANENYECYASQTNKTFNKMPYCNWNSDGPSPGGHSRVQQIIFLSLGTMTVPFERPHVK